MRPTLLLLALVLAPQLAAAQSPWENLARTTALTAADDFRIGKGYVDMAGWLWGRSSDAALVARVEALTRRIVAASDRPDFVFNVIVTDSPEVNAAALPGGFLLVHRGITEALPEEQLAFVIGHEIGHVLLRHYATTMNMTQAMQVVAAGQHAHEAGDTDGIAAAEAQLDQMATRYARHLELEADLYGLLYALRAGFPARGGTDAMRTMRDRVGEIPAELVDHANHPPFSLRIEELDRGMQTVLETHDLFEAGVAFAHAGESEAAAAAFQQFLTLFPKSPGAWSNLGMAWLQLAVRNAPPDAWLDELPLYARPDVVVRQGLDPALVERARDAFARALSINGNLDAPYAGLAVLARRQGDLKGAQALLDKAITLKPEFPGYRNNLGVLLAIAKGAKAGIPEFERAKKADPRSVPARVNLASALEATGKGKEAIALWTELLAVPRVAGRAHEQLIALGARPKDAEPPFTPPAPAAETDPQPSGPTREVVDLQFGAMRLGQDAAALESAMGAPPSKEALEEGYYQWWSWPEKGLTAVLIDNTLSLITATAPCDLKTGRGLTIGAGSAEVEAAYGAPDYTYDGENGLVFAYDSRGATFYFDDSTRVYAIELAE